MIILDLETTGVQFDISKIIEFAAIKIDDNFQEIARLNFLVNPECEIPGLISTITNIYNYDVDDKPVFDYYINEVKDFITDDLIVGHNVNFDISFLQKYDLVKNNKYLDTCDLANIILAKQESYALEILCSSLNIPQKTKHRAIDDTLACFELLKILINKLKVCSPDFKSKLAKYNSIINSGLYDCLCKYSSLEKHIPEVLSNNNNPQIKNSIFNYLPDDNYLIDVNNLAELKDICKVILNKKQILSVPYTYINFISQEFNEEDIIVIHPAKKYLSESRLALFLQKTDYNYFESVLLFKILLLQAEGKAINKINCSLSWQIDKIWQNQLQISLDEYKTILADQLNNRQNKPLLLYHDTILKQELKLKPTDKIVFFELTEFYLDYVLRRNILEKNFLHQIFSADLKNKFSNFIYNLKQYLLKNSTENYFYGYQKNIEIDDFSSSDFQKLQIEIFDLIKLIKTDAIKNNVLNFTFSNNIDFLKLFFTQDNKNIRCLSFSSDGEFNLYITPHDYKEILSDVLPPSASFIFSKILLNDNFNFWERITGITNLPKIKNKNPQEVKIYIPSKYFPIPKGSNFNVDIKNKLTHILNKHYGQIILWCNSKAQVTELLLYFSSIPELKKLHSFVGVGVSGSKNKTLGQLKNDPTMVIIATYEILDEIILTEINFDVNVIVKLPFDGNKHATYKVRSDFFQNSFDEYFLPKSIIKTQKIFSFINYGDFYIIDSNIRNKWASAYFTLFNDETKEMPTIFL